MIDNFQIITSTNSSIILTSPTYMSLQLLLKICQRLVNPITEVTLSNWIKKKTAIPVDGDCRTSVGQATFRLTAERPGYSEMSGEGGDTCL